jgi:hypothetical protein
LVAVVGRRWRQSGRGDAQSPGPEGAPEQAIAVQSFQEMDDHIARERCTCEGRFKTLGESTVRHEEKELRRLRLECRDCEELRVIYFDQSA